MPSSASDPVVIRAIAPAERDQWQPLWTNYLVFYEAEISADVTAETWSRLLDPREPMWAAMAWSGSTAIGMVHWIFHRSTWTSANYCYLQDLFVDPAIRGSGVGRRLIVQVYAEAETAKCARVYWLTHETNRQAMALYDQVAEKSGFVQYRKQL